LLADLRLLREVQLAQREALAAGDLDRLDALHEARTALHSRLGPLASSGLGPADMAEATALAQLIAEDQAELVRLAAAARDAIGRDLRTLGVGRAAVKGYRPTATSTAVLVDSTR
jgi:flagellar protein FliT